MQNLSRYLVIIIIACISLFSNSFVSAQENLSSVFMTIPDSLLVGMNTEERELLISFRDSVGLTVETSFGGSVERLAMSEDFISLQTSKAGNMQIKMLPLVNNSVIIGIIRTVCGQACDSNINFYTTSWKLLDSKKLVPDTSEDWFLTQKMDTEQEAVRNAYTVLDWFPIRLHFNPNNTDLIAEFDIKSYLYKDDYKRLKPYISEEPKVLKWDMFSYK